VDVPFIGSEALSDGLVANKHQLRTRFQRLYPDVYLSDGVVPNLWQRTAGAWLWSRRGGVIAGLAASALHGAKWIADDVPIEMIWSNPRSPAGIATRRATLAVGETTRVAGMTVTTPERSAFDLGRLIRGDAAVARLDALGNATRFDTAAVHELARLHRGSPGIPHLLEVLDLHDRGAQSPKETWLRLLLVRAGFPRPRTQIPVFDDFGRARYYLDMGWDEVMVAAEYDGDHHRERSVFTGDIVRAEFIAHRGWTNIRVVAGVRPSEIVNRVRRAWTSSVQSDRAIA
jgi:very-short-patch-repair endonuclease